MERNKKAQDISPAPKAHNHYNKAERACLTLFFISILLLVVGQAINNAKCTFLAIGIMCAAIIFDFILIEEDN